MKLNSSWNTRDHLRGTSLYSSSFVARLSPSFRLSKYFMALFLRKIFAIVLSSLHETCARLTIHLQPWASSHALSCRPCSVMLPVLLFNFVLGMNPLKLHSVSASWLSAHPLAYAETEQLLAVFIIAFLPFFQELEFHEIGFVLSDCKTDKCGSIQQFSCSCGFQSVWHLSLRSFYAAVLQTILSTDVSSCFSCLEPRSKIQTSR